MLKFLKNGPKRYDTGQRGPSDTTLNVGEAQVYRAAIYSNFPRQKIRILHFPSAEAMGQ
jgi:hypothetical protein